MALSVHCSMSSLCGSELCRLAAIGALLAGDVDERFADVAGQQRPFAAEHQGAQ